MCSTIPFIISLCIQNYVSTYIFHDHFPHSTCLAFHNSPHPHPPWTILSPIFILSDIIFTCFCYLSPIMPSSTNCLFLVPQPSPLLSKKNTKNWSRTCIWEKKTWSICFSRPKVIGTFFSTTHLNLNFTISFFFTIAQNSIVCISMCMCVCKYECVDAHGCMTHRT